MTKDFNFFNQLTKLSYFYKNDRNIEKVEKFLSKEKIDNNVLTFMNEKKILIDSDLDKKSYYSRNELYYNLMLGHYNELQEKIMNSKS